MANYIITKNRDGFSSIGKYNFCELNEMVLPEVISFDSETTGLSSLVDDLFSIQIGTGKDNYLIDLQDYSGGIFPLQTIRVQEVIPYLLGKTLVGHNISFDIGFLYKHGYYPSKVRDTMLASMILYNGSSYVFSHSLGNVMERELGISMDKSEQKNIHKVRLTTAKAIFYCFNDVDRLLELHNSLEKKVYEYDALEAYYMNCDFILALVYMERCRLPIDKNSWLLKMEQDLLLSNQSQKHISKYIYDHLPQFRNNQLDLFDNSEKINVKLSSVKQVLPVFHAFGIDTKDKEGKDSINEKVINKSSHSFIKEWLLYKGAEQRVTTFGQNVIDKIDNEGRLYCSFNVMVDTGRLSARRGNINFLNFPRDKETRTCFKAKAGNRIIVADYDSEESTLMAYFSQDVNCILNLVNKRDPHSLVAREAFPELKNLTDKEIKKDHDTKRQVGKVINFACAYGSSGLGIANTLNVDKEEGERLYNVYKNLYPGIFEWGKRVYDKAIVDGYITGSDGYKLQLPFFKDYKEKEEALKEIDWETYRTGKTENVTFLETGEKRKTDKTIKKYVIVNKKEHKYYNSKKQIVSEFFKLKGQYQRLCLNMPIQNCGAHILKRAMHALFSEIKSRGHLGKVLIVNTIHDEAVLEVPTELVEQYKKILETCMMGAGKHYIKSDVIKLTCEANEGDSWGTAK